MADLLNVALRSITALPAYTTTRGLALLLVLERSQAPMQTRDLAKALGVSKPCITRATNSLKRAGLVIKCRRDSDLRDHLVLLTEKGRTAMRAVLAPELAVAA